LVWIFCVTTLIPPALFLLWSFSSPAHVAAFRAGFAAKAAEPLLARILGESDRWSDFIGLSSQRVHVPLRIPVRLHVCAILAAGFWFLHRFHRRAGIIALTILAVTIAWFFYMPNKGPRYLLILTPLFAIVLGYLAAFAGKCRTTPRLASAAVALVLATQLAANTYWIYGSRHANYPAVAAKLRQIIPPGASVYGITTFWLALYDHPYYAYDRTKLDYAVQTLHPQYMILHDRVMENGSGHGQDDFAEFRPAVMDFVRTHGTLAGRVPDEFYGNLEIYRVSY
jgi:hypothetical protein